MSMKTFKSRRWMPRKRSVLSDAGVQGLHGFRKRQLLFAAIVCIVILLIVYRTTKYQYQQAEVEAELHPFTIIKESDGVRLDSLPRGIVHSTSDLEFRSLKSSSKDDSLGHHNLLAMAVGIKQKHNVDTIVQKFLTENFTIMLFHYDGNVDGWSDLDWSNKAINIMVQNQTKCENASSPLKLLDDLYFFRGEKCPRWFAKRFLHPAVVSIYDYIFLWEEDLGVGHFNLGRYLDIVKSEGLEISQPALDPNSTGIHHRITIHERRKGLHRRIYDSRGSLKCLSSSQGPPCTGWVEGMAPVFSRAAWYCTWHLIQNDLVHGWGLDMKLGYCAQVNHTEKVGVVDSEYIVHQGIQTLGSSSGKKTDNSEDSAHAAN